jgi:hypothetical protein
MDWREKIKHRETYRHFWLRNERKQIVGCIATKRCQDGSYFFAYSAVNPKDNFDPDLGRRIVYERLELDRPTRARLTPLELPVEKLNIKQAILTNLAEYGPPVIRPAAELWLKTHVKEGDDYIKDGDAA